MSVNFQGETLNVCGFILVLYLPQIIECLWFYSGFIFTSNHHLKKMMTSVAIKRTSALNSCVKYGPEHGHHADCILSGRLRNKCRLTDCGY